MASFKVVISDKNLGKSIQKEVSIEDAHSLLNKKIGDRFHGEIIGLTGYEFLITGGTDSAGFPMRKDIEGVGRKKIFTKRSKGVKKLEKGQRVRKTVAGNTIYEGTAQINVIILKHGAEPLFEDKTPKEEKENKKEENTKDNQNKK